MFPACIYGGQFGKGETRYYEDKVCHIQKIKMKCLVLFYFWCKGVCLEDHKLIFDVLDSYLYFVNFLSNYGWLYRFCVVYTSIYKYVTFLKNMTRLTQENSRRSDF